MKGYEQLEFEETKSLRHFDGSREKCFDKNGNEIKIGDYVVAVCGEAKFKGFEGNVTQIHMNDGDTFCITVSTYGGKILERYGNPFSYEVILI